MTAGAVLGEDSSGQGVIFLCQLAVVPLVAMLY